MKVFIDTNILIDYFLDREGSDIAEEILVLADSGVFDAYLCSLSIFNIIYAMRKRTNPSKTLDTIEKICLVFNLVTLDENQILKAARLKWKDFEDAQQFICAKECKADLIITNNVKDFALSTIPVMTSKQFKERYLN